MHVCAIASARATIGGPLRNDRLKRTSARAAAFQSLTTVAHEEVAHKSIVTSAARAITRGNRIGPSNELGTATAQDPLSGTLDCQWDLWVSQQPLSPASVSRRGRRSKATLMRGGASFDGGRMNGSSIEPFTPPGGPGRRPRPG